MNKEEIKFNTDEDIIMQIEMMSYMEYNSQIATANDYIGDIYSYKDIEYMELAQAHYEKELSYQAIKQLQRENKQLKDNWNKLKEFLKQENYKNEDFWCINLVEVLEKMQELEKGSEK